MRIALINDWFSEKMGYTENCLPKALAKQGHDVHMITSNVQSYFDSPGYAETYEPFIGPAIVETGTKALDGYTLHRLPHAPARVRLRIVGLRDRLKALQPEVVQALETYAVSTLEAAWAKPGLGCKLFLESHVHASVFRTDLIRSDPKRMLWWWAYRSTAGAFINSRTERCYAISDDAAKVAAEWFGITRDKLVVRSLGVDTDTFHPQNGSIENDNRSEVRSRLGFAEEDIVCIYTGRFSLDKGPQLLAKAIDLLGQRGEPFRALFVGQGTELETGELRSSAGSRLHPFVPVRELAPLYRAADIGVWPKQESTSQIDAAACGLPIVLSDRVSVRERVTGNGVTYAEGDVADLAQKILSLKSPEVRTNMGRIGSERMRTQFSWQRIAQERLDDYAAALAE